MKNDHMRLIYWLFIIAIASDPIINTIQGLYFKNAAWDSWISFPQLFRGGILLLILTIIVFKNIFVFKQLGFIWPVLLLSIYALLMSIMAQYPLDGVAWSFRVIYVCTIFMTAYLLALNDYVNKETLWKLAAFVVIIYLISQITAWYAGYGGIRTYRTELGSLGFVEHAKLLSWAITGAVPCFFLYKSWRSKDVLMITLAFCAILLTMRRTSFLALLIVILFIGVLRLFRRRTGGTTRAISVIVPSLLLFLVWYVLNSTEYGYVFMKRLEDLSPQEGTAAGRYIFQKIGLAHILNRGFVETILGEGAGYSKILLGEQLGLLIGMHSDWLDIAISYGLIGVTLFVLFFWGFFRAIIRTLNMGNDNLDALISIFLIMGFGSLASGGALDPSFSMPFALLGLASASLIKNQ